MEWQPIETAPKDGTRVLLWAEMWELTWGIQVGAFYDHEWNCEEGSFPDGDEDGATHWMPLPSPPRSDPA